MRMGKLASRIYDDFKIEKLGYDFMGYVFENKKELSYHHIQPRHYDGKTTYENGALLCRATSHNYIHTIENVDFKVFVELSQILKDEHSQGRITEYHLRAINEILEFFEAKYEHEYTSRGIPIIKEEFVRTRKLKK